MSTIAGTVRGIKILQSSFSGIGARSVALLTVDFAAYTGSTDDATVTGIPALIEATTRNGKTVTLRDGICAFAGKDTNGQLVYTSVPVLDTNNLDFNLSAADGTELTSSTACVGVGLIVAYDEA